ncbi:MAG: LexA family transcriptional regulator [Coprobacillus sp.]
MDIKQLVKEYKNKYNLTNKEIAEQFNVTHTTVGRWLNGTVKTVQQETIDKMSHVLKCDVNALLNGTAITLKKPILGMAKAGYDMFLDDNYMGEENITLEEYNQGDFFLQVSGDSMIGAGIRDGGLVYVKKCSTVCNGDIAVIAIGDEVTIKEFKQKKDGITLIASHPSIEDRVFTNEEVQELPIRVIGKVIYAKNYV